MRRVTSNYQQHSSSIKDITQKWEQQNANLQVSSYTKFQQNLPNNTVETNYNIMQTRLHFITTQLDQKSEFPNNLQCKRYLISTKHWGPFTHIIHGRVHLRASC